MLTNRTMHRRTVRSRTASLPDDRVVIATALLALSILALMLCAGIA